MKVSSPIGDLPFKPTSLQLRDGAIQVDGSMGAWPAHVRIEPADLLDIAYLLRYVLVAVFAGAAIVILSTRK